MLKTTLAAAIIVAANAECPNACSGHGECGDKDQCKCYNGYDGADCSQRFCSSGLAFVDIPRGDLNHDGALGLTSAATDSPTAGYSSVAWSKYMQSEYWPSAKHALVRKADGTIDASKIVGSAWAAAGDEAHFYTPCSGKGSCDRDTGLCTCFDGYTGSSCQRTTCANDCSGHGLCRSVKDISAGALNKKFVDSAGGYNMFSGVQTPFEYRLWDAEKNTACVCDPGFSGVDCSLRECPRGDDPLTTIAATCGGVACNNEIQAFTIQGGSNSGKSYYISFTDFNGVTYTTKDFTLGSSAADNNAAVKAALEGLPNGMTGMVTVASADVAASASTPKDQRFTVSFDTLPGNVPAFTVQRGRSASAGVPAVVQPAQPVQAFSVDNIAKDDVITAYVYPQNSKSFRPAQMTADRTVVCVAAVCTPAEIVTNMKALFASVSALSGLAPVDVTAATTAAGTAIKAYFPNMDVGANKIRVTGVSSASVERAVSDVTLDSREGNTEFSICSNRGLCDYSVGTCTCFPGYTGAACSAQNALAM